MRYAPTSRSTLLGLLAFLLFLSGCGGGDDGGTDAGGPTSADAGEVGVQTGTLAGTVKLEGKDQAEGVTVTARGQEASPDESGYFELNDLEPGPAVVEAKADGFASASKTVVIKPDETATVDLELSVSNHQPELRDLFSVPSVLEPGETGRVTALAVDADGDKLGFNWSVTGDFTIEKGGETDTITLKAPDTHGAMGKVEVEVSDSNGGTAKDSVTVETSGNRKPVIRSMAAVEPNLTPGEATKIIVVASDPDGSETLNYSWESAGSWKISNVDGNTAEVTAPDSYGESGTVTVKVEDAAGLKASDSVTLTTGNNEAPRILSLSANPPQAKPGGTVSVRVAASDPHGDKLQYQWTAPQGWKVEDADKATAKVTAPTKYGETGRISVTVSDGYGESKTNGLSISTQTNGGPIIASFTANPPAVSPGGKAVLSVQASDPEGQALSYKWTPPKGWTTNSLPGKPSEIELIAPGSPGARGLAHVRVRDSGGKTAKASVVVSTSTNQPPAVTALTVNPPLMKPGATATVNLKASDPDGDSLSYNWTIPKGWTKTGGSGSTLKLKAPAAYGRTDVLQAKVSDGATTTTATARLMTTRNSDPRITDIQATPNPVKPGGTVKLTSSATDPDGDALSHTWSVQAKGWSLQNPNAASTQLTAPKSSGQTTLTLKVTDGHGGTDITAYRVWTTQSSNHPPTITSVPPAEQPSAGRKTWTYQVAAHDRDGDSVTFKLGKKAPKSVKLNGKTGLLEWSPTRKEKGKYAFDVVASDGKDASRQRLQGKVGGFAFKSSFGGNTNINGRDYFAEDFDGDGHEDILTAGRLLRIATTKKGSFDPPTQFTKKRSRKYFDCRYSAAVGDIDNDGDLDIAVSCNVEKVEGYWNTRNDYPAHFVWENDGSGSFSDTKLKHAKPYEGRHRPTETLLGDIDGDGNLDLIQVYNRSELLVWKNTGAGRFSHASHRSINSVYGAWLADIDSDNAEELLLYASNSGQQQYKLRIIDLDSAGNFTKTTSQSVKHGISSLSVGDFNNDQKSDIALITGNSGSTLKTALQSGGTFKFTNAFNFNSGRWKLGNHSSHTDIDQDGATDWVFYHPHRKGTDAAIVFGNGKGGSSGIKRFQASQIPESDGAFFGNWNGDGQPDLYIHDDGYFEIAY